VEALLTLYYQGLSGNQTKNQGLEELKTFDIKLSANSFVDIARRFIIERKKRQRK